MGSSSFASESFSAPQRAAQRGELVVRPDTITIVFALKKKDLDPQKAIGALEKAAADVLARFQEATSGAATMKMCGASVRPVSQGKSDDGDAVMYAVVVDGSIDVRLAPEQDYWARSRLIASITQATRRLTAPSKDDASRADMRFDEPQITLKDPEVHRAKLVERWAARARAFGDAVQAAAAPLYMLDCAPPAPIELRPISLEEVGLSLSVSCRVDTPRSTASPK